jgi:transposase
MVGAGGFAVVGGASWLLAQRDAQVGDLTAVVVSLTAQVAVLTDEIAALRRQLGKDSSNSSQPPSADSPFTEPARKRSSRSKSDRKPGKQSSAPGVSRGLSDAPDRIVVDLDQVERRGCGA